MGLRADSARPQRVSGSARTDSRRAESARNPIASHVNFGDDSALSAFTRTQWAAAFSVANHDNGPFSGGPREFNSEQKPTASLRVGHG